MSTEVADVNDAGFRQWGRPKEDKTLPQNTRMLQDVRELESLVQWLKIDVWGHNHGGRRQRVSDMCIILERIGND